MTTDKLNQTIEKYHRAIDAMIDLVDGGLFSLSLGRETLAELRKKVIEKQVELDDIELKRMRDWDELTPDEDDLQRQIEETDPYECIAL